MRAKSSKQRCPVLCVFEMLKSHASFCPSEEYFAYTSAAVAYCKSYFPVISVNCLWLTLITGVTTIRL